MTYYENANFLIIYGGRDDNSKGPQNTKKDLFVLDLEHLSWVSVEQIGLM
jgi:hypothetical protein